MSKSNFLKHLLKMIIKILSYLIDEVKVQDLNKNKPDDNRSRLSRRGKNLNIIDSYTIERKEEDFDFFETEEEDEDIEETIVNNGKINFINELNFM